MQVELDQSGKIEDTNRLTVIGYASSSSASIAISAKEKQKLQRFFRALGQPRVFVLKTFVALITLLIQQRGASISSLIIDTEYPGHERFVRNELVRLSAQTELPLKPAQIHFQSIGKKSPAHSVAYRAFRAKRATFSVTARDVLRVLI